MISVRNLSFEYAGVVDTKRSSIIDNISLSVPSGAYCSIVGPSGCGKSTLLQCIAGLIPVHDGSIKLNDGKPEAIRKNHKIGFVFQKPVFFEWKHILDNVALPALIAGRNDARERALNFINVFQLSNYEYAYPHQLSGGMLARAALARALVVEPEFLFLDEAFNHLDEALREKINHDIQTYWLQYQPTVFAVTHSIAEAILMSDIIFVLTNRPTRLLETFRVPFQHPRNIDFFSDYEAIALGKQIRQTLEIAHKK